jgi:hypothetical protein
MPDNTEECPTDEVMAREIALSPILWEGPAGQTHLDVFERASVWLWEHGFQDISPDILSQIATRMAELNPQRNVGKFFLDGVRVWLGVCKFKEQHN